MNDTKNATEFVPAIEVIQILDRLMKHYIHWAVATPDVYANSMRKAEACEKARNILYDAFPPET